MALAPFSAIRPWAWRAATWAYANLRFRGFSRPGLRILTYHSVGTPIEGDIDGVFNMAPEAFERHMRHLANCHAGKWVPLEVGTLKRELPGIIVTFDDGYMDNLSVAAPLLVELGIPFTVFVCTGAAGERRKGFLAPEDVRELSGLPGASIGSHTVSHHRLTQCADLILESELAGSKAYLEDLLGKEVDVLAYPFGAVDRRVRDEAEKAGYRIGVTCRFDLNAPLRDPLLLSRTTIYSGDDPVILEQKLQGKWDWYRWRHADPASDS
jgi:hypothetical protein